VRQQDIDVLLISESHYRGTEASKLLANEQSAGNAKGGAVILIRSSDVHIPITPAAIETTLGPINFGAAYYPRDSYVLLTNSMPIWKFTILNS